MTHPFARRLAAGIAVPARSSHIASEMLVAVDAKTKTLSDSFARRTWGSDSPLMRLVTFAPRSGAHSGRCGHRPTTRFAPPALLKGRQSGAITTEIGFRSGVGGCEPEHGDHRRVA